MAKQGSEEKTTKKPETDKDKDFKDPNLPEEGTKDAGESESEAAEPVVPEREIVRGEDVVKSLREKGYKI